MSEYKGYEISTTTFHANGSGVTEVGYCVRHNGGVVHHAAVPGPFDSLEFAHSVGEAAARAWIDQHQVRTAA